MLTPEKTSQLSGVLDANDTEDNRTFMNFFRNKLKHQWKENCEHCKKTAKNLSQKIVEKKKFNREEQKLWQKIQNEIERTGGYIYDDELQCMNNV